jgi:DNA polymerase-3 subunit beta
VTYLIDVLANSGEEMVKLELQDSSASALFSLPEQPGFKYVVMPMRI